MTTQWLSTFKAICVQKKVHEIKLQWTVHIPTASELILLSFLWTITLHINIPSTFHFCCYQMKTFILTSVRFPPAGDHEPQGHYDGCYPQFPPAVPAVYPVQRRYIMPTFCFLVMVQKLLKLLYLIIYM